LINYVFEATLQQFVALAVLMPVEASMGGIAVQRIEVGWTERRYLAQ
jgi:Mg/Co/Ni transporter MgtE